MLSKATLILDKNGIPKGVRVDDHELPNVASAHVEAVPNEVTKLLLVINVDSVETERDGS